jgi:hypothetical protein
MVARGGTLGDAAVYDYHAGTRTFCFDEIVGPQLGLDDDQKMGLDAADEAPHHRAAIQRRERADFRAGNPPPRRVAPAQSHGGYDKTSGFELAQQAVRDGADCFDFADRRGMNPDARPLAV